MPNGPSFHDTDVILIRDQEKSHQSQFDSGQFWRRDKPTRTHGPWFQQQDVPFWELKNDHVKQPEFATVKDLEAARNPFYHSGPGRRGAFKLPKRFHSSLVL